RVLSPQDDDATAKLVLLQGRTIGPTHRVASSGRVELGPTAPRSSENRHTGCPPSLVTWPHPSTTSFGYTNARAARSPRLAECASTRWPLGSFETSFFGSGSSGHNVD